MRKKNIINGVLILLLCGCGQQNQDENDSKFLDSQSQPVIKTFFDNIALGKYKIALNELISKNKNIDLADSLTINLRTKFNYINESSGNFVSKRLLRKKELGDDLGVYIYLVRYEKNFYPFTFTFYNNGAEIRIYKFAFDDNIDTELEEAIKLYVN